MRGSLKLTVRSATKGKFEKIPEWKLRDEWKIFLGKKAVKPPKIHERGGKVSDTKDRGDGDTKNYESY